MSLQTEQENYQLGYSDAEKKRLLEQSDFLIDSVGYTIHPTLKATLPSKDVKVAELATGTGAFLLSLSRELPSDTAMHGYDISDIQFLPASELPENLTLHVLDAKQPPPPDLMNTYDVIFIRYLNVALKSSDWVCVAQNALQMLKPGGAIQWFESDFTGLRFVYSSHPNCSTENLHRANNIALRQLPDLAYGPRNMASILETAGFVDVKEHMTSTDRRIEDRMVATRMNWGAVNNIVRRMVAKGPIEGGLSVDEWEALVEKVQKDLDDGAYTRCDVVVGVGRKPS